MSRTKEYPEVLDISSLTQVEQRRVMRICTMFHSHINNFNFYDKLYQGMPLKDLVSFLYGDATPELLIDFFYGFKALERIEFPGLLIFTTLENSPVVSEDGIPIVPNATIQLDHDAFKCLAAAKANTEPPLPSWHERLRRAIKDIIEEATRGLFDG